MPDDTTNSAPMSPADLDALLQRAETFEPNPNLVKTAVLVTLSSEASATIETSFGSQTMSGPFYAVADGEGSYGAARSRFESTHRELEPNRWVRSASVQAVRATGAVQVETVLDGKVETTVDALPGDWIVRQPGGEVMVVADEQFRLRYRADD